MKKKQVVKKYMDSPQKIEEKVNLNGKEIDEQYSKILDSLGISETIKSEELSKRVEIKYEMIQGHLQKQVVGQKEIRELIKQLNSKDSQSLIKTHVLIRTNPISWTEQFLENGGIKGLLSFLASTNVLQNKKSQDEKELQRLIIECFHWIVQTHTGRESFIREKELIHTCCLLLDSDQEIVKIQLLGILTLLTNHSIQGFNLVLDSFNHYKLVKREKKRFFDIIRSLMSKSSIDYYLSVFTFFNQLLFSSPDSTTRLLIYNEFNQLCIDDIMKELKKIDNKSLNDQFKIFKNFEKEKMNLEELSDPKSIVQLMTIRLSGSDDYYHFMNILLDLLLYSGYEGYENGWKILEKLIKKAIQEDGFISMNHTRREIELEEKINHLTKKVKHLEKKLKEKETKISSPFKRIDSPKVLSSPLKKFESTQSSPKIESNDSTPKNEKILTPKNEKVLTPKKEEISIPNIENLKIESLKSPLKTPLDVKTPFKNITNEIVTPMTEDISIPKAPMMFSPPPPPKYNSSPQLLFLPKISFPTLIQTKKFHFHEIKKKNTKDSIFIKKGLAQNSLEFIDYLKTNELTDLFQQKKENKVKKEIPIIILDPLRSNKISLSRGAMRDLSNQEIRKGLLEMNVNVFNEKSIKILSNILPTKEEIDNVLKYKDELILGDAEKFILSIYDIPNLYQRVEEIKIKLNLPIEVEYLLKDVDLMNDACKSLLNNEKFHKLLSLILCVGNTLNGKITYGFHLSSLLKLNQTKSNDQKMNLLQYIVQICKENEKLKDILDIKNEFSFSFVSKLEKRRMNQEKDKILNDFEKVKNGFELSLLNDLITHFNELEENLKQLTSLYQEDFTEKPQESFEIVNQFIYQLKRFD